MDMTELGQAVLAKRKLVGMTQAALAAKLNMSRATISYLENGKLAELGLRKFMAICSTLGLALVVQEEASRPTLRELVRDNQLEAAKRAQQARDRALVRSGARTQESMFLISPQIARSLKIRHRSDEF